jgi:predicted  nucleic acid-binding Zn-ribbon protein
MFPFGVLHQLPSYPTATLAVETMPEALAAMISALLTENRHLKNEVERNKETMRDLSERMDRKHRDFMDVIAQRDELRKELRKEREKPKKPRKGKR